MANKILTPQNIDLRLRLKEILEAVEVPSVADPEILVPNKWIVFTEEPDSLVTRGENIDILRSPMDVVTFADGTTEEQINAWIIEKKPVNPTRNQIFPRENQNRSNSNSSGGVGKVRISSTFVLGCIKSLAISAARHSIECDAVRQAFNERRALGFPSPLANFVESHTGLSETIYYKEKFGDAWAHVSEFEITVNLFETYN